MEHFDDMLRNSLASNASDSRFEFKEEYWLQAMALLELEEKKRKRRRALAYFSVLALLLIPAAICYYNRPHTHNNLPAPVQENATPSTNISNMADAKNNTKQTTNQENTSASTSINSSDILNTQEAYKPTMAKIEANNQPVIFQQNSINKLQNDIIKKNTNLKETSSNLALGSSNLEQTTTTQAIGLNNQAQITSNTTPTTNNPDNTLNPASTVPEQTTVVYNQASSPTTPLETTLPHIASAAFEVLPYRSVAVVTDGQSTITSLAEYCVPLSMAASIPMTKVHIDPRTQWGLTASLSTPSGLFLDEKPGIALGMTARFRLNRTFSINTDLIWRRWKGNRNFNQYEDVSATDAGLVADLVSNQNSINYSFGYIATDITTSPKAFHLLELPVSLQYRIKKVALECGLDVSVRLVESIYQEQYQASSLAAASLVKSGRSYQAYSKSDRFQKAILAGVHWQPTRKWSFGVRTYWNTNPSSNLNFQKSSGFNSNVLVISPTHAMTAEARVGYFF